MGYLISLFNDPYLVFFTNTRLTLHFKIRHLGLFSIIKTVFIHPKKRMQKVAHSLGVFAAAIPTSLADLKVVQVQMYNYLPAVKAGGVFR